MGWAQRARFLYRAWRYRLLLDREEIAFLRRTLRSGQTSIDIGANKGGHTYWMHRAVGRRGRVFAFEPQPNLADDLRRAKAALRLTRLTVVQAALFSSPGEGRLAVSGEGQWAKLQQPDSRYGGRQIAVPVESLSHYFARHAGRPIHFIKCDVEGQELEVFRGGEAILREDRPTLVFECECRHHSTGKIDHVFQYLQSLGYEGFFWSHGMRPLSDFDPEVHQDLDGKRYINNFAFLPV